MPDEIIEGTATEVGELPGSSVPAIYVEPPRGLAIAQSPQDMVVLATSMANALADIVEKKKLYTNISGKKYPDVEAWLTIARLDNVVAREHGLPVRHEDGSYEAVVDLIRLSDGMVVGQGSAICGTFDDPPWNDRGSQAKRGMAVTRATSRACRQHYAWIMAIAGYQPTPAEDMPRDSYDDSPYGGGSAPAQGQGGPSAPSAPRNVTPTPSEAPGASEDGSLTLVVSEPVETNVRMVGSSHNVKRWEGQRAKVEVKGKIANRKHTAIVLGPLAEAVAEAGIQVGDAVRVIGGVVEEIKWSEDPTKPLKKEIWGAPPDYLISDVQVTRDGTWVSLAGAMLPLESTPAAPAATEPPSSASTTTEPPASSPSPTSPTSAASSSTDPSPAPSATTSSEPPSSPTTARKQGEPGSWDTLRVRVDSIEYVPRGNIEIVVLRTAEVDTGELVVAALAVDIEEQIGPKGELKPGDIRQMYGEWKDGGRFVIDTIGVPR